tara:strand:- start:93 stop:491 length:399 start_codon:yes stop_codon:yes gene_type:complete
MNDSLHIKSIVYVGCNFLWYRLSLRKIATQEDNQLLTSSQSSETDDDQSPIDHKEEQDPHINAIKKRVSKLQAYIVTGALLGFAYTLFIERGDIGDSLDLDRLGLPLGGALTGGVIGYWIESLRNGSSSDKS